MVQQNHHQVVHLNSFHQVLRIHKILILRLIEMICKIRDKNKVVLQQGFNKHHFFNHQLNPNSLNSQTTICKMSNYQVSPNLSRRMIAQLQNIDYFCNLSTLFIRLLHPFKHLHKIRFSFVNYKYKRHGCSLLIIIADSHRIKNLVGCL